jgi:peptidoglycan/LPS O-acetylase OafA/YrhL
MGLWPQPFPNLKTIAAAAGAVAFGICVPQRVRLPAWVESAARASYGIYLCQFLILGMVEFIYDRLAHLPREERGIGTLLFLSGCTFLASWYVTSQLQRFTLTRRLLLGGT